MSPFIGVFVVILIFYQLRYICGHPSFMDGKNLPGTVTPYSDCFGLCLCQQNARELVIKCPQNESKIIDDFEIACNLNYDIESIHLAYVQMTVCWNFNEVTRTEFNELFSACVKPSVSKIVITHSVLLSSCFHNLTKLFPSLVHLEIRNNFLTDTIVSLKENGLAYLTDLNLSKNDITDLYMKKENINSVRITMFRMEHLDLSRNNISFLDSQTFCHLQMLKNLYLANNRLQYIHPLLFSCLPSLKVLHIQNNLLGFLPYNLFLNLNNLDRVYLHGNRWSCSCSKHGLQQYKHLLLGESKIVADREEPMCYNASAIIVKSMANFLLDENVVLCPTVKLELPLLYNISILTTDSVLLHCNSSSSLLTSIYWITPHGIMVNKRQPFYNPIQLNDSTFKQQLYIKAHPTYMTSSIEVLPDGSLVIKNMRHYLSGAYTCVAWNPSGNASFTVHVSVKSDIEDIILISCLFGASCACVSVIIGVVVCLIDLCCTKCNKKPQFYYDDPDEFDDDVEDQCSNFSGETASYWQYESPQKCVTPAEGLASEGASAGYTVNIWETLEAAGARLRDGVYRLRGRAAHVRQSSSNYMHNLRESSSLRMETLRRSSKKQLRQMKSSVVVGVEQVKQHVKSMKEFCGTGDLPQTISVASVSNGGQLTCAPDMDIKV